MHIVNIFTIPHTGINTIHEFLAGFNVFHDMPLEVLAGNNHLVEHEHDRGLNPKRHNLVWGHLNDMNMGKVRALASHWPVIVPIRDPLLSIISAKKRNPTVVCAHIIKAWNYFLEDLLKFQPFVLPIEIIKDPDNRLACLQEMIVYLKLDWVENCDELLEDFAEEWPEKNSHGSYPLKLAYYNKDMKYLIKNLKTEIAALRILEPVFRPLLESYGYHDLIWFSSPTERTAA